MDKSFSLTGKVIGENNYPFSNCKVLAYDKDFLPNSNDFLGDSIIDKNGFFQIEFDMDKFVKFLEILEGSPDILLILKAEDNNEILRTNEMKTKKEIEYHIKVTKKINILDPNAPDIYSGNDERMKNILKDIWAMIGLEFDINKDILNKMKNNNNNISDNISKEKSQYFIDNYEQIIENFDNFLVIAQGLINNYMNELKLSTIQYDGPQVPRFPYKDKYNQVIIWPRKEKFKWE